MVTCAHTAFEPSITDALSETFRSDRRAAAVDRARLAHDLVDRAAAAIASLGVPAPDAARAVIDAVVERSMRAAMMTVTAGAATGGHPGGEEPVSSLRDTVAGWARDRVAVGTVLALVDRGFDIAVSALAERAGGTTGFTADIRLLLDVRAEVTSQVIGVFATTDTHSITASSRRAFIEAVVDGRTDMTHAAEMGLRVHDRYQVIALTVTPPGDHDTASLESAVDLVLGAQAMPLLSGVGGTVVLPVPESGDLVCAADLVALSDSIGAEVTATRVHGTAETIPTMACSAHEILDLARAIGRPPGLYTMDDLVMEYHLTRPGPAHDGLAGLIRSLEESSTELLETLRVHLSSGMNRRETARRLAVHPNTVDNRMSRVADALGIDMNLPQAIAQAQSAIFAFDTAPRPHGSTA